MSTLTCPGAQLYYEVSGNGPLLMLISGASGTGESFHPLASYLISQYEVVIYDRRGFSRSLLNGPQDYERRLETDADDVRRLIEHLTNQPAIVFGGSSGAIVALEVISHTPAQIHTVVAHEPPAVKLLPNAATWLAFFDGIYDTFRTDGIPQALHQFSSLTLGSADQQVLDSVRRDHPKENLIPNAAYWLEHELRQYPRVELYLDALAARARQMMLAGGRDSQNQVTYQPNKILAQKLGINLVDLPGGHLGFMASPAEFARELI